MKDTGVEIPEPNGSYSTALVILGVLFSIGMVSFVYSLIKGADRTTWGLFTTNFLFLMGITQFGVVFSAFMRIARTEWGRALYRLAEVITVAFFPFAIVIFLIIYFFGKEELFYWVTTSEHLNPYLNPSFFLWRNLLALLVFYLLSFIYLWMDLLPDAGMAKLGGPQWRKRLYERLFPSGRAWDVKRIKRNVYKLSPIVLLAFVIANTFIALDFGMTIVRHWHSNIFPPYYWVGNLFAGTAALLLFAVVLSLFFPNVREYIGKGHIRSLGIMLIGFTLLWIYLFWSQFIVIYYGNIPNETAPLWRQMEGHYAPFFWAMIAFNFFIPLGALIFVKVKASLKAMCLVAVIINIGIWINRYLTVVSVLSEDHRLFQSLIEILITIGLFAGVFFVLLCLFRVFPMISMWEVREIPEEGH